MCAMNMILFRAFSLACSWVNEVTVSLYTTNGWPSDALLTE